MSKKSGKNHTKSQKRSTTQSKKATSAAPPQDRGEPRKVAVAASTTAGEAIPPLSTEAGSAIDLAAVASGRGVPTALGRDPRLPAVGTILVKRDRLGRARCECTVEPAGFGYKGTVHPSLSAAATAAAADIGIKGRVNGFVFWGLVRPPRPAKDQALQLRRIAARYQAHAAALLKQSDAGIRLEVRRDLQMHATQVSELLADSAA